MSTRTTYTSTVTVPVYAAWKCEHCGEINFSAGVIACEEQESTTSFRSSKHEEAKERAQRRANLAWKQTAYEIIVDPNSNAQSLRNSLSLQNTHCTKCGKKPKWDKNMRYVTCFGLCFAPAILTGIIVLSNITDVIAWLVFLPFLSALIYGFSAESRYKKMMAALPKEYTPVIGSLNPELIEYANRFGTVIPSPDECFAIVRGYGKSCVTAVGTPPVAEENASHAPREEHIEVAGFCRKCGVQLHGNRKFCHKCGTEIIK